MDTIPIEAVKWLLYPFIPLGKITILQGDPGEGKTTLALQIIAALTTGKPVWEGAPPMEPVQCHLSDGRGRSIRYHQAAPCGSGRRLCKGDGN